PYLYDEFYRETQTGLPVMRTLVLNYENDPHVYNLNDEYMVGEDILTAPVVQQGQTKRAVYLPKGEWIDFWNGVEYSGGNTILVDAPIDKLPLFIKKITFHRWIRKLNKIHNKRKKI